MKPLRLLIAAALVLAVLPSAAVASRTQESMFQDDPLLVFAPPAQQAKTLDRVRAMGVDRLRVSVFWALLAPASESATRPNFNAADPAAYPQTPWEAYDRLIRGAQARGIGVNLNPTSPAPRWATAQAPRAEIQKNYGPVASEFGLFVRALATRYGGGFSGLPRVDYWSIWNEPNQAGWLTPQWSADPRDPNGMIETAPHTYRGLLDEAWAALQGTGHGRDTILIGETAPKGEENDRGITQSLDALRFVRQLYCLDDNLQFLQGTSAEVRGCPVSDPAHAFPAAHPALFHATGYGHHPYELLFAPHRRSAGRDWVTIANLPSLSRELRRIYQRYAQRTQEGRGVPLYLTEYGYQTPPDPLGVPFRRQAAYINEAEYIAYRNPLVRSTSQFLLNDDAPVPGIDPQKNPREAWRTFQSGLRTLAGRNKPAYRAYVTPIFVVSARIRRGRRAHVFGAVRPLRGTARRSVRIQWRGRGSKHWRTVGTRTLGGGPRRYLDTRVRVPRSGSLRLRWRNGKRSVVSRSAAITVR
ncbi:MAG: cellulase family glycosylhydrolase [Actinomycetota bacterium]|nr:cellulase family glycosylhydrolase [Actinomycetota bacterium]